MWIVHPSETLATKLQLQLLVHCERTSVATAIVSALHNQLQSFASVRRALRNKRNKKTTALARRIQLMAHGASGMWEGGGTVEHRKTRI